MNELNYASLEASKKLTDRREEMNESCKANPYSSRICERGTKGCSVEHKEWGTSEPQAEKDRKCSPGLCAGCAITRDDFDNPNAVCNHER